MASSATGAAAKRTACGKHQPNLRSSQVEFSTTVRLRAASVLALLCIHASEGLLHYSPSLQACSRHNLGGEVSSSRRSSPFGRKRCRNRRDGLILPPSKCFNSDVDWRSRKHDVADDAAVHTLLIDNYDSYTYNLFQLLAVVNGRPPFVVYNDDDDGDLWCVMLLLHRHKRVTPCEFLAIFMKIADRIWQSCNFEYPGRGHSLFSSRPPTPKILPRVHSSLVEPYSRVLGASLDANNPPSTNLPRCPVCLSAS